MAARGGGSAEEQVLALLRQHADGVSETVLKTSLEHISLHDRARAINALLVARRLQIFYPPDDPTSLVYKEVQEDEAVKLKGLNAEEMLVLQHIRQSSNVGIWTKDLKIKTNLQQPAVTKILKSLEQRKLIKAVKSVANANRKVYMLYELEPARDITGGAWYTENEFDAEFFEVLQRAAYDHICHAGDATLDEVAEYIRRKGLSRVELRPEDVAALLETLVYEGRVDAVLADDGEEHYRRAALGVPPSSAFTDIPCGVCPVFNECSEDGQVSPATCVYYQQWLDF